MKFSILALAVLFSGLASAGEKLPNIVLIFVDDLGYGDLGCYGATKVKTPNIDKLATEGKRFTDAHSASAVCTPSRYGLITGEYPMRINSWGPTSPTSKLVVDTEKLTIADVLKNAGYSTSCFGKWHLGFGEGTNHYDKPLRPGPQDLGFDYYFGVPVVNSAPPYVYVENDKIVGATPDDPIKFLGKKSKAVTPKVYSSLSVRPSGFPSKTRIHSLSTSRLLTFTTRLRQLSSSKAQVKRAGMVTLFTS